jgi:hypothetical protein
MVWYLDPKKNKGGNFWEFFSSVNSINFSFLVNYGQFFLISQLGVEKRKEKKRKETLIITP